jgi:hypothetical protein
VRAASARVAALLGAAALALAFPLDAYG